MIQSIKTEIAHCLEIPIENIKDSLEYQSIQSWDSMGHIKLMTHLEEKFSVLIDSAIVPNLRNVGQIVAFILKQKNRDQAITDIKINELPAEEKISRGLNKVIFDKTKIAKIDQELGAIYYRGYSLSDLVEKTCYEEVAFLLLFDRLPSGPELEIWKSELASHRKLDSRFLQMIEVLKDLHPSEVLRTLVSSMGILDSHTTELSRESIIEQSIRMIGIMPSIVATHHRLRLGLNYIEPQGDLSHAANFLYMLTGHRPSEKIEKAFDKDLILHAEHSSNASAFAARVAMGSQTDYISAMTASLATFAGKIHGGAIEEVLKMISEIKESSEVKSYIDMRFSRGLGVPGFGHRIYRKEDPRAPHLYKILNDLNSENDQGQKVDFAVVNEIKNVMTKYRSKGLDINVDFYAGLSYRLIGIPDDLAISIFFISRVAGVSAHILEQFENNILIRPLLKYEGEIKSFPSIEDRE